MKAIRRSPVSRHSTIPVMMATRFRPAKPVYFMYSVGSGSMKKSLCKYAQPAAAIATPTASHQTSTTKLKKSGLDIELPLRHLVAMTPGQSFQEGWHPVSVHTSVFALSEVMAYPVLPKLYGKDFPFVAENRGVPPTPQVLRWFAVPDFHGRESKIATIAALSPSSDLTIASTFLEVPFRSDRRLISVSTRLMELIRWASEAVVAATP